MSNARQPTAKPYSLERYRKDVEKETPFELWLSDEEKLSIPRPTGDAALALEQATSGKEQIEAIAGDHASRLLEILGPEDFQVLSEVVKDMTKHFGLDKLGQS